MYEHVKTGCKHIPPSEQPLQCQSGYFLNKPHMYIACLVVYHLSTVTSFQNMDCVRECESDFQAEDA